MKLQPQEPLRAMAVAMATALGTGIGGALASGAWRTALYGLGVVAFLCFVYLLFSAGLWHREELQEVGFEHARDGETTRRGSIRHEREVRGLITEGSESASDLASQKARESSLLERQRRYISDGRSASVEIIVLDDHDPDDHKLVGQAGRLDQAIVRDPATCGEWLESLDAKAYPVPIRVAGRRLRFIGVSDTVLSKYDHWEIQHAATQMQSLLQSHAVAHISAHSKKAAT